MEARWRLWQDPDLAEGSDMAVYSVELGHTVGAGSDYTYELPAVTISSGEQFKRCRIRRAGAGCESYMRLRGNARSVLGQDGFNTWTTDKTAISWTNGKSPKVTVHNTGSIGYSWRIFVDIETEGKIKYEVRCYGNTDGNRLTADKETAQEGETVTLYPQPNTGYELDYYTSNREITITNNRFVMPGMNTNVTAHWKLKTYTITKAVSPAGAGTVSGASSGTMGSSITLTQTPAAGYYFAGWQISTGTIGSNGTFTMPAQNVTVTAKYLKRSEANLNKSTLTGGESAVLTISSEKSTFSHKYKLSFGTGMETDVVDVAAGTTAVTIQIPAAWALGIPNAKVKSGGTLTLWTYNGATQIGSYQVTGLTYAVPADAAPEIGEILTSIVRSIGGTDYANVGSYYVQNHCGVRIQADAEAAYDATIVSMAVAIRGYAGASYNETVQDDEIDFTSGLLTEAGTTEITVTATDSRGITVTEQVTISVDAYSAPSGSLHVWRVDSNGNPNDTDEYGKFALTKAFTEIGSNTLTATLSCGGVSVTTDLLTGDILPGGQQQLSGQTEHTVTLVLQDAFEMTVITAILPSAKFIIHITGDGSRMAFFRAVSKLLNDLPAGKDSLIEIDDGTQVYIGTKTLEELIEDLSEYTEGSGIGITAEKVISLKDSGASAGSYGQAANIDGNNNATVKIPYITIDRYGRVTSIAEKILTCKNTYTWRGYQRKSYTYAYSNIAAGGTLDITGNNFKDSNNASMSTPSGYFVAAVYVFNSGNGNVDVTAVRGDQAGTDWVMRLYNHSSSAKSGTASLKILYLQN